MPNERRSDPAGGDTWPMAVPQAATTRDSGPLAAGSLDGALTRPVGLDAPADYAQLATVDPERYVLGKEIARGGMGRIVAARDRRLGRAVAIKELLDPDGEFRARFEREARITAKLQHPAIVSLLEAGTWPDGEPFYVMKLVSGHSLDQAIRERPTFAARLGLLPHIIAAVDALAYAHSLRVLHRDLKPANVLVGEFGETVVIDWGLAKDLADPADGPDMRVGPHRSSPASASASAETQAGAVLGTPSYMPPEQALGDTVDERADVYALGALLYHVLAGSPPYLGATAAAVLHEVVAGPPPSLAERAPEVPPDLVTITSKAMAHRAEDRYPSAKELAEDLKKFQTGHLVSAHDYTTSELVRRWIRKHRAPVAVAGIGIVLLVALGALSVMRIVDERERTEQQRVLAERSRGEAEDLASFMLGDLRAKLQPLGKLDLLADVAKKSVAYYDARGDHLSDAELANLAHARRNLGDVLKKQKDGDLAGALAQYRAALAITEQRAAAMPGAVERQRDVAEAHERIGDIVHLQGDAKTAIAEYQLARAIRVALAAGDPASLELQTDLESNHDMMGTVVLAQGDYAGGLAEYRASLAIAEALAAKEPTSTDRQAALGLSHTAVGNALAKLREFPAALAEYRASLGIAEVLAAKEPANADHQRALSVAHNKIGNALSAQGDVTGALVEYRADLAIATTLAANDPTNGDRQSDLSVTHNKLGNTLLAQKDVAGALAEYRASLAITTALAAKDPANADRQRAVSVGHNKIGDAEATQNDYAGALADYTAARGIIETLAAADPTNAELQVDRAVSHQRLGDLFASNKNAAGAVDEYRAGLAIAQALLARAPTNADAKELVTTLAPLVTSAK